MKWAALIAWVITAGGGFVLLGIWLKNGGMRQRAATGRIRPPLILSHFALAASGLVLWIIYVATYSDALAWIAFILLLGVAGIGFTMLAIWLAQRRGRAGEVGTPQAFPPAEQRFPTPIVALHGVLAAATLVLVFLAAAEVGS